MPSFAQSLKAISAATAATMATLLAHYEQGDLTEDQAQELAALLILGADSHAVTLADMALAARLSQLRRDPVLPLGLELPSGEAERIGKAIATSFLNDQRAASLDLVARSSPLEAGQTGFHTGMTEHGVPGWRRVTDGHGCVVCTDLAQATFIPISVSMWHHNGCGCHPDPVLETR